MINKGTINAGQKMYELFKAFQGGKINVQGSITQEGLQAIKKGGIEELIAGLERPAMRYSAEALESGANFDVAVLNGKKIVAAAKGEVTVPKDAEGFFEAIGRLFGPKGKPAEKVKEIKVKDFDVSKQSLEQGLARIRELKPKEVRILQMNLADEIQKYKQSVSPECWAANASLTEAKLYGLDVDKIFEATKNGKLTPSKEARLKQLFDDVCKATGGKERQSTFEMQKLQEEIKYGIKELKAKGVDTSIYENELSQIL